MREERHLSRLVSRVVTLVVTLLVALPGVAMVDEPRAHAEELLRHVVKAGDSCASIAQRYYGDTRFVDLLHGANPELARRPPPHVLVEGTVLVIPPKPAPRTGPDAQLTAVQNQVDVLTPETKPGKANDPLFRGNRVSTQASSAADVTFRDETQVKLGERTLVIILGDARAAAARVGAPVETQATLVTGNLRAFMAGGAVDAFVTARAGRGEHRRRGGEGLRRRGAGERRRRQDDAPRGVSRQLRHRRARDAARGAARLRLEGGARAAAVRSASPPAGAGVDGAASAGAARSGHRVHRG